MSQVTEQSVRFQTALASIKLIQASAVLDLTEDDFDFLTSKDRKSGSAGMPRPSSYAAFCLKKKPPPGLSSGEQSAVSPLCQCGGGDVHWRHMAGRGARRLRYPAGKLL